MTEQRNQGGSGTVGNQGMMQQNVQQGQGSKTTKLVELMAFFKNFLLIFQHDVCDIFL